MMQKNVNKLLLVWVFIFFSCTNDEGDNPIETITPNTAATKIMPLGASRVDGNRPSFESYRYELWKLLKDNNITFDFIGTQTDEASYPTYNNLTFDTDHEGRGGWTSTQILGGIESWLVEAGSPDIVLFSSPGGNDALGGQPYERAAQNIISIVDAIQANNPNVTIVIEQMAPARTEEMTTELSTFLNRLRQDLVTLANEKSTETSKILLVDMTTGFNDSLLADNVHYNEAGARFIANKYLEVLKEVITE